MTELVDGFTNLWTWVIHWRPWR